MCAMSLCLCIKVWVLPVLAVPMRLELKLVEVFYRTLTLRRFQTISIWLKTCKQYYPRTRSNSKEQGGDFVNRICACSLNVEPITNVEMY